MSKSFSNFGVCSWFTCVGKTCCPQYRCENEIIGALFGRIGDSVWKTTLSQSIETAPNCDFGPNGSTLHRHGNRRAELNSGHGCHESEFPDATAIHSQSNSIDCVLHLCSLILWREEKKSGKKNMKLIWVKHMSAENWIQNARFLASIKYVCVQSSQKSHKFSMSKWSKVDVDHFSHRIVTTDHNCRCHFHYSHLLSNWVSFKWKKKTLPQ